jgi:hypothetical protein
MSAPTVSFSEYAPTDSFSRLAAIADTLPGKDAPAGFPESWGGVIRMNDQHQRLILGGGHSPESGMTFAAA